MDRNAFESQVKRILSSGTFASKAQLRRLLEILAAHCETQNTLKPDRVMQELWPGDKERTSADLATARNRLRKALEAYYAGEGAGDEVLIRLPRRVGEETPEHRAQAWITAEARNRPGQAPSPLPAIAEIPADPGPAVANQRKRPWKWVALTVAAAACALLAAALMLMRMRTVDDRPSTARLDGNALVVVNARGKELWTRSFPDGFWQDFYKDGLAPRLWFGDLDGSGRTSVLLVYHPAVHAESSSSQLICFTEDGEERWRWNPGRVLPELGSEPAIYQVNGLAVLNARAGTPRRIVVASLHYPQYPTQVALVDANGKTVSEYWHSGHFEHMIVADLDGDGKEEILALGESNGYNQATLVALDPDRMGGASLEAARPELQIHGMGIARERIRLLFPRCDLNLATMQYNEGREIAFSNGVVRVAIEECQITPYCLEWYEFDSKFELRKVYADDGLRDAHARFYLGAAAHPFSAKEAAAFWKVRCLAGCAGDYVPAAADDAGR